MSRFPTEEYSVEYVENRERIMASCSREGKGEREREREREREGCLIKKDPGWRGISTVLMDRIDRKNKFLRAVENEGVDLCNLMDQVRKAFC